jgi:hypothetical protein
MNRAIELHDSKISSVNAVEGEVQIRFATAYVHASNGRPGIDAGDGFVQPALLTFSGAKMSGARLEAGPLSDGWIALAGNAVHSLLPVDFMAEGDVTAQFLFAASGLAVDVTATSVCLELLGDPVWLERFPGSA